ncbi:hypothetical protein EVA_20192 [gut metagenome]|uniref:Uncharacterized protein n=1 Tax=gut metagenome TaxID=749906 RepID=J9F9W3_9ZZZZ
MSYIKHNLSSSLKQIYMMSHQEAPLLQPGQRQLHPAHQLSTSI